MPVRVGTGPTPVQLPKQQPTPVTTPQSETPAPATSQAWEAKSGGRTRPAYDPAIDANALYQAMKGGMTGLGTDEPAIYRALANKTPDQITAIKASYKDHYGADLDTHLKEELSGLELTRAQRLMGSDQAGADAAAIEYAQGRWTTDKKEILSTLGGKSPDEIAKIDAAYKKDKGHTLQSDLTSSMSGSARDEAMADLKSSPAATTAVQIRKALDDGFTTDKAAIFKALEGKTPTEINAIRSEFSKAAGRSLDGALGAQLGKDDLSKAKAMLDGMRPDPAKGADPAEAARAANARAKVDALDLKDAATGMMSDHKTIERVLTGKTDAERKAIIANYPGDARKDLGALHGNFKDKALALLDKGKLSDVEALHFAMAGLGTDEQAIHDTLRGKTKAQIDTLAADYKKKYGEDLKSDLSSELSGRDWYDATQELKGAPQTAAEALQRANEERSHERDGWLNKPSSALMGLLNDKGSRLDQGVQKANDFYKQALADNQKKGLGNKLTADQEKRLGQLLEYSGMDVSSYREAKDKAADTVTNVATTAAVVGAGAIVTVASGGTAAPLAVAAVAATAGAATRVASKQLLEGSDYGWEAAVQDGVIGAADGATAGLTAGAAGTGASALRTVAAEVNAGGLGNVVAGGARRLSEEETYTRDGLKNLAEGVVTDYTLGVATAGAVKGAKTVGLGALNKLRGTGAATEAEENAARAVATNAKPTETPTAKPVETAPQTEGTGTGTGTGTTKATGGGATTTAGAAATTATKEPIAPLPPGRTAYKPNVTADLNADGITDASRVGVPGTQVPTKIPRMANLTPEERAAETRFADAFEQHPDEMAAELRTQMKAGAIGDHANHFSTDEAKLLSPDYSPGGRQLEALQKRVKAGETLSPTDKALLDDLKARRAIFNIPTHQTANALAKRAFVQRLDELAADTSKPHSVLITAGGVGSGKSYALAKGLQGERKALADAAEAVWDSAGEQNSTELPWIMSELNKRGIKGTFVFVDGDPTVAWQRAASRAEGTGRMVDARLFADSYPIGAKNFQAFENANKDNPLADFIVLNGKGEKPFEVPAISTESLNADAEKIYEQSKTYLQEQTHLSPAIQRGGRLIGERIWGGDGGP